MSTRRQFLKASGSLAVCFAVPACRHDISVQRTGHTRIGNRLQINADGTVDLMLGKVEFGQGIGTALAQLAAEELDVDISRFRLHAVDTDSSPDEFYTFSSISIQQAGPPTRQAAAQARAWLLGSAADSLGAAIGDMRVADARIEISGTETDLDYWSLIGDDSIELESIDNVALKTADEYTVIGRDVPRIDVPGKVFGAASFLQDLKFPNMLHARVVRPPTERAGIARIDMVATESMPGVEAVIRDGNFVAVVAQREGQARSAARKLAAATDWALPGDLPEAGAIDDYLKNTTLQTESVAERSGDATLGNLSRVSAEYFRPYQAHASISPSAAVALFDDGKLTIWSHAQGMYPLRSGIAQVLGLDIENVRCIHLEASGCYGHNGADDAACDVAAIAMQIPGRPVRLQWERADEMTWEPYGSAMHIEIDAGVDADGQIRDWQYDLWSCPHTSRPRDEVQADNMIYAQHREGAPSLPPIQSIPQPNGGADRNAVPLYGFDSIDVKKHLATQVPLRVSALRGLGAYGNIFAIESFIDELAARYGEDPLAYRLRHLTDQRAVDLLTRLADIADWRGRPAAGTGTGWGLGFARFKNRSAWLGVVVQLFVEPGGIRLQHACAVCDAGLVINPDGVRAQIEGGIVQSASWTLKEQVRFDRQRKLSVDWASYPILRFDEVPELRVELMSRDDQPSLGVGEVAQGPTAAAIANAVFHASGQRIRKLPLTPYLS